jgi:hypothetical protein
MGATSGDEIITDNVITMGWGVLDYRKKKRFSISVEMGSYMTTNGIAIKESVCCIFDNEKPQNTSILFSFVVSDVMSVLINFLVL